MSDYTVKLLAKLDPQLRQMIPSGVEVYDALMQKIEPELTSAQVGLLKTKYAGQSPAERTARMKRYQEAFIEYQEVFVTWAAQMHVAIDEYKDLVVGKAASQARADESAQIKSIEEEISETSSNE